MKYLNFLVVQMEADPIMKCDDGQSRFGEGGKPSVHGCDEMWLRQSSSNIFVCDYQGAAFSKIPVAVCMVVVKMSIDDETDRLIADSRNGFSDRFGQRSELIINQEYAIVARKDPNISARSSQHVNVTRHMLHFYLNIGEFDFESRPLLLSNCHIRG
jgi:hypothetical protein